MLTDFRHSLRPAIVLLVLATLVTGLLYPALVTGLAQVALPRQANGSLVQDGDRVVGSSLIAQNFTAPRYFHPRASAAGKDGYDASSSAGTNLAPGAKDLADAVGKRVAQARAEGFTGPVPADLVTTSASGLDPDLSPAAALAQVPRVAAARGLDQRRVQTLVQEFIERPALGIIGEPRVNVLLLNRQLDAVSANRTR